MSGVPCGLVGCHTEVTGESGRLGTHPQANKIPFLIILLITLKAFILFIQGSLIKFSSLTIFTCLLAV